MSDEQQQPEPTLETAASAPAPLPPVKARRSVRYPGAYVWFIFVSALDIMLTYLILHPVLFAADLEMTESRGSEANALADQIIQRWDVPGMVIFKFILVVIVIGICEFIGHRRDETGRRLAEWAVAITVIPVVVALVQMGLDLYFWFYPAS